MTLQLPESTYRREQYTPDDRVFSRRLFQVHFAGGHLTLREMVRYRKMDFTPDLRPPLPEVEKTSLRVEQFWNMRVKIVRGPLALEHRFAKSVDERGYELVRLEADLPEADTP